MSWALKVKHWLFDSDRLNLKRYGVNADLVRPFIYWFYIFNPFTKTEEVVFPALQQMDVLLGKLGVPVQDFFLKCGDLEVFMAANIHEYFSYFFQGGYGKAFVGKAAEHFVSLELSHFKSGVFIDIAASVSPFYKIVKKKFPQAQVFRQDLEYKPGMHGEEIGGSAVSLPLKQESVDFLTLHNSIEHFEGDADTAFIRECRRLLKNDGQVIILPIFLKEEQINYINPTFNCSGLKTDKGAKLIYAFNQPRFMRHYSVQTFKERIIRPAQEGFKIELFRIILSVDFQENIELAVAMRLTKL